MNTSKQYIYRIKPTRSDMLETGPTEREAALVGEHFEYLQRLTATGTVLLAGRTQNDDSTSFGIVIFRAESDTAAQQVFDDDPAVAGGVFAGELHPFSVALVGDID
ncbi:MAG: hypothetical protein GY835_02320 [bacterium]|nr:hypothetical protein [bacterium]